MRTPTILFSALLLLGCGSSNPQPATPTAATSAQDAPAPAPAQQASPAQRELCVSLCTRAFDCASEAVAEMKKTLEQVKPGSGEDPSVSKAKAAAEEARGRCLQGCDRPPAAKEQAQMQKMESCRSAATCEQFATCVEKL